MKNTTRWTLLIVLAAGLLAAAPYARAAMAAEKDKPEKDPPATEGALKLSDYQELMTRNLFSRDQRPRRRDFPGNFQRRDEDRMTMNERLQDKDVQALIQVVGKGEADIVLTGVVDKDGITMAFLEDRRPSKPALAVKTGDVLAGGKVGKINLSMMEYIAAEKTTEITFGFNLLGKAPASTPTAPVTSSTDTNRDPGSGRDPGYGRDSGGFGRDQGRNGDATPRPPGDATPAPTLAPGAAESILEKMRKKRQAEGSR